MRARQSSGGHLAPISAINHWIKLLFGQRKSWAGSGLAAKSIGRAPVTLVACGLWLVAVEDWPCVLF